jgi:hypothetical protein
MNNLDIWINVLSPLSILISIFVSAILIKKQIKLNYGLGLRNKSLGYSLYSNDRLRDARLKIERSFGSMFDINEPITMSEINEKIKGDSEVLPAIMTILAHWENMALAIHIGVADERVCYEMVASTLNQHVKVFRNFIETRQEKNPRIYYYLMALRRRWLDDLNNVRVTEFRPIESSEPKNIRRTLEDGLTRGKQTAKGN